MERIAAALCIEPLELRRINMLDEGDVTATGQRLKWSVGASDVLDAAVRESGYTEKRAAAVAFNEAMDGATRAARPPADHKRRGVGLSFFFHGAGFTGSGEARMKAKAGVEITPEGGARILTGSTEIGQGTRTIFCQIVADELEIPFEAVEIEEADTSKVPDSGPTVASRTTMVVGRVVQLAAREAKEKLRRFVAERFGAAEARLIKGRFMAGDSWLADYDEMRREYIAQHGSLTAYAQYASPPGINWDDATYSGDAYPVYSWGAEVAEVEVDMDTLEVTVSRITTAQDIGRAINPVLAAGQIEGGTLQAVGYGLLEELVWDRGRVVNNRLTNYIIPTALDAPDMQTVIVEKAYPHGPFGAKGVGELPMDGGAPAIAAAVFHATGAFVGEIPITPERLQAALEEV
jgi:CO/xanthine dehydrogenase Mo-binding subunit